MPRILHLWNPYFFHCNSGLRRKIKSFGTIEFTHDAILPPVNPSPFLFSKLQLGTDAENFSKQNKNSPNKLAFQCRLISTYLIGWCCHLYGSDKTKVVDLILTKMWNKFGTSWILWPCTPSCLNKITGLSVKIW